MSKTLYKLETGEEVNVYDAVDAKEYLQTGRYSVTPPEPPQTQQAASTAPSYEVKKTK